MSNHHGIYQHKAFLGALPARMQMGISCYVSLYAHCLLFSFCKQLRNLLFQHLNIITNNLDVALHGLLVLLDVLFYQL
jgi:hypothetical protein